MKKNKPIKYTKLISKDIFEDILSMIEISTPTIEALDCHGIEPSSFYEFLKRNNTADVMYRRAKYNIFTKARRTLNNRLEFDGKLALDFLKARKSKEFQGDLSADDSNKITIPIESLKEIAVQISKNLYGDQQPKYIKSENIVEEKKDPTS